MCSDNFMLQALQLYVHYQVDAHTCSQPPPPAVAAFHHTLLEQLTPQHTTPPDRPAVLSAASSCTGRTDAPILEQQARLHQGA